MKKDEKMVFKTRADFEKSEGKITGELEFNGHKILYTKDGMYRILEAAPSRK